MNIEIIEPGTEVFVVNNNEYSADTPTMAEGVVVDVTISLNGDTKYFVSGLGLGRNYDRQDVYLDRDSAKRGLASAVEKYVEKRKDVLRKRIAEYEHHLRACNIELKAWEESK